MRKVLPLDAEEHVTIIGAGGVGLTAVAVLTALGHENITVLDRTAANFEAAIELGARSTFLTNDTSTPQEVLARTGGPSAAVLDFVNSGVTAALAFTLLDKAGTMVQVGLFGGEFLVSTATLIFQQKQIIGSYTGGLSDLEACVEMARHGELPRPPISVRPMSLRNLESALDALSQGRSHGRMVLEQPTGRRHQDR
ncbi:zinc-binding dehydrogenase [Rhodococcus sp. KBW08]|uniref:zinc-binding dehydrogenase n=1 Tax=Rhodococcus sp. KBW08 TaxID=2144188 RepID=UPI0021AA4935|nr:zinc-binding dehydrogenase [Rhodococcus sp. KBW08]